MPTRLLFGVPPLDPVTLGGAGVLSAVIGLAGCFVPPATRIDATEALRHEYREHCTPSGR